MNPTSPAENILAPGDLCLVVKINGWYCDGFGPGTIVTLAALEHFGYEIRWRVRNHGGDIAWALPKVLKKLPPDQFERCDSDFDWRNIEINHEVAA